MIQERGLSVRHIGTKFQTGRVKIYSLREIYWPSDTLRLASSEKKMCGIIAEKTDNMPS